MATELDPLSRLLRYPTSLVSDALDELGVMGVLTGMRAQRVGQGRIAGYALPVHLALKSKDPAAYREASALKKLAEFRDNFGLAKQAIYMLPPSSEVLQSLQKKLADCWPELEHWLDAMVYRYGSTSLPNSSDGGAEADPAVEPRNRPGRGDG